MKWCWLEAGTRGDRQLAHAHARVTRLQLLYSLFRARGRKGLRRPKAHMGVTYIGVPEDYSGRKRAAGGTAHAYARGH